jgi:DUF4097 and DUF4098 domain-containing protein YvlB
MICASTITLLSALLVALPVSQERPAKAPETDQTVPVARGARLSIDNHAGEVIVRTWNKDSLRVQARHSVRMRVDIRTTEAGVLVHAQSTAGPPSSVDYEITAPAWMPIKIEGQYNFVTIEGAQAEVSVASVRGDIIIKGGTGTVTGKSIQGQVIVEGARGKINVSSVNEAIRITGASGEITAETTNGDITLTRIDSSTVDVATVNGDIVYEGTTTNSGRYRFTTHNGDITMTVPETANATFSVRTYSGDFSESTLPLKGPPRSEVARGKRVLYTLGNGSAEVEMESFGGAIRLRRTGATRSGRN